MQQPRITLASSLETQIVSYLHYDSCKSSFISVMILTAQFRHHYSWHKCEIHFTTGSPASRWVSVSVFMSGVKAADRKKEKTKQNTEVCQKWSILSENVTPVLRSRKAPVIGFASTQVCAAKFLLTCRGSVCVWHPDSCPRQLGPLRQTESPQTEQFVSVTFSLPHLALLQPSRRERSLIACHFLQQRH